MCTQTILNKITNKVVQAAKSSLKDKLDKVILYGSYARGDYDDESDIDIMVLADIPAETCHSFFMEHFLGISSAIGLEYDIFISIDVQDCTTFYKFLRVEPFYQNVLKYGVELSA